ncbi:hypothetical protein C8R43DRAFT_892278 [Mycena crocata]|nr:hypothetical protein C8R43DRAFT_892278 [Mycena crocata]
MAGPEEWIDTQGPPAPRVPIPIASRDPLQATKKRQASWDTLLPILEEHLAHYQQSSYGRGPPTIINSVQHECTTFCGTSKTTRIQCLYISLFPMSPSAPRTAVSIDLLEVYRALFERSCDAITALAAALHTIYDRRGFRVVSQKHPGVAAKDPFRVGLSQAVQSYSNLRTRMQARLDAALTAAADTLFPPPPDSNPPHAGTSDSIPTNPQAPQLTPGRADRILQDRCPTCFASTHWGRPFNEGGDVQMGSDGCFSYRHLRSAGDGPISYDPSYFVSKEKVDAVRDRIAAAREKKPAKFTPPIPEEAIDACANSWDAANEKKKKVDPKRHDASGIFVVTCRHSQVLFLCNIDTPGEQQQYVIALLEEVLSHLPKEATVVQCYDVACVTEHSVNLYPILKEGYRERISFVINAMHAYGHQWICQLVYSPRLRRGLGLTDAEGVERFWSRIRKLIGITRNQWHSRRIWMLDQYAAFVNSEGRENLGDWIIRQQTKNLPRKRAAAEKVLRDCRIPDAELRRNWAEQKAAQTSVRAHAPARLRRELDKVLVLQNQIDVVEQSIADAKKSITSADASSDSLILLRGLEKTHDTLSTQADALYASLNIQKAFPELQDLPLEFVRTLLIMRDLKINIRSRAVGSFHEWENLDRAVRGHREALGTKLHQSTRKAISKRQPALLRAIAKFNEYCANLEQLRPPGCQIPIPEPLSTQLNGLRNDPSLHEDVWITPSAGQIPRWVADSDVRDGIRAMHGSDRCKEEAVRLNLERTNMGNWLRDEFAIVNLATATCADSALEFYLQRRQEDLHFLKSRWAPALEYRPIPSPYIAAEGASTGPRNDPQLPAVPSVFPPAIAEAPSRPVTVTLPSEEDLFEEGDNMLESGATDMIVTAEEIDPGLLSDAEDTILITEVINSDERRAHTVVGLRLWPTLKIEPDDLDRIASPTGRLNGFGMNGIAASLWSIFAHPHSPHLEAASRCAIFSTYDLPRAHFKKGDDNIWSATKHVEFWDKPIWLIPIHRPDEEHWVLAVVNIPEQRLFFFDSLACRSGWRKDLHDTMILITRLVVLANRNNHPLHVSTEEDQWTASPLFTLGQPCQHNGHDCGLWVLCMMAAIMRGFDTTGISEQHMGYLRATLNHHVLTLPIT